MNDVAVNDDTFPTDTMESDIRATVDNVITQLASLESDAHQTTESSNFQSLLPENASKKDILQQALKNSGLSSKNKIISEGMNYF